MTQFTNLTISVLIIFTVITLIGWCYYMPRPEPFCGKWNPDIYLPVNERLRFPFPENRLQSWYLPAAYWGDKPRFDYAFREDTTNGQLTPVWPNLPIKQRIEPVEY
mgnify:CR=1 FL=1